MKNSGSRFYLSQTPVPKMPPGLVDLMEGMTKEVLKRNPTDVYKFCSAYMRKLLEIRDGVVQEQFSPITMRQAKGQNQHKLGPKRYPGTCKEINTLISNNSFKENFIPAEELKMSSETELKQNIFKIPLRHEMDVMEASEIQTAQEFTNTKTIEKFTPATMFGNGNVIIADENCIKMNNTESHYIELPNRLESKDDYPTDMNESNVDITTSLAKNKMEEELALNTDKVDETNIVEENQSNIDNTKIIDEKSMSTVVIDEMDMSGKDEINVTNLLQEEIIHESTQNYITESESITKTYPMHLNITKGQLKESSMDHVSKYHNVNDLHSINKETENLIIDSNSVSIDEVQTIKENQHVNHENVIADRNLASIDEVQKTKEKELVDHKNVIIDSNLASIDKVYKIEENQIVEHGNVIADSDLAAIDEAQKTKENQLVEHENVIADSDLASIDEVQKTNENQLVEHENVIADRNLASIDEVQKTKKKQLVGHENVIANSNLASINEVQKTKEKQLAEHENVIADSNLASIDEVPKTKENQLVEHENVIADSNLASIDEVQKTKENQLVAHEDIIADRNLASIDEVQKTKEKQLAERENGIADSNLASIDEAQKTKKEQLVGHENVIANSNLASIDEVQKTKEKQLAEHENVIADINLASIDEVPKTIEKQLVEHTNTIADSNLDSVDEVHKTKEENQLLEQNDLTKEEKISEEKVTNELNELRHVDQNVIEKQGNVSSESKEDLNNCTIPYVAISKGEAILLNNIVCDHTNLQNDLRDNNSEELHSFLYSQNDHEGQKVSKNEEYNNLEIKSDTSNNDVDQLISAQNINVSNVDKQSKEETSDVAPTNSNKVSLDNNVVLEKTNSRVDSKNSWENVNESSNMDLEMAAITIQKVFRSFLYKSRGSTFEDVGNDENVLNDKDMDIYTVPNNERRSLGITRIDSVLQTVNEEKSLSLSTDDSSTLSSAATTIQAHVRGFLVRNKINSSKTLPIDSLINSDSHTVTSLDNGDYQQKNKTVLNIHIVPEAQNKSFSRDETVITSVDLSLDCSPSTSINLHPLGYDKSEPRKQLKREDAFQSVSPPSNNSRKYSEDIESVREIDTNDKVHGTSSEGNALLKIDSTEVNNIDQVVNLGSNDSQKAATSKIQQQKMTEEDKGFSTKISSDELDVVTPFVEKNAELNISANDNNSKLIHSGEFHDGVVPTNVARNDTSVVRGE